MTVPTGKKATEPKARRNRIRRHARKGRLRMESNPTPEGPAWIRDRFIVGYDSHRGIFPVGPLLRPRLRERFRILRWILSLLGR